MEAIEFLRVPRSRDPTKPPALERRADPSLSNSNDRQMSDVSYGSDRRCDVCMIGHGEQAVEQLGDRVRHCCHAGQLRNDRPVRLLNRTEYFDRFDPVSKAAGVICGRPQPAGHPLTSPESWNHDD